MLIISLQANKPGISDKPSQFYKLDHSEDPKHGHQHWQWCLEDMDAASEKDIQTLLDMFRKELIESNQWDFPYNTFGIKFGPWLNPDSMGLWLNLDSKNSVILKLIEELKKIILREGRYIVELKISVDRGWMFDGLRTEIREELRPFVPKIVDDFFIKPVPETLELFRTTLSLLTMATSIQRLDLSYCSLHELDFEGMGAIAEILRRSNLTEVNLSGNRLGQVIENSFSKKVINALGGLNWHAFYQNLQIPQLTALEDFIRIIKGSNIQKLILDGNSIPDDVLKTMLKAVKTNTFIQYLPGSCHPNVNDKKLIEELEQQLLKNREDYKKSVRETFALGLHKRVGAMSSINLGLMTSPIFERELIPMIFEYADCNAPYKKRKSKERKESKEMKEIKETKELEEEKEKEKETSPRRV